MKLFLSLLLIGTLGYCLPCAAQSQLKMSNERSGSRISLCPQLRYLVKERTIWTNGTTYCSANFSYSRSVAEVSELGVSRASSYVLPLVYGLHLNPAVALEGGFFGGLNRSRSFGTSMFRSTETSSQSNITYGLLVGLSHKLREAVNFKLRYRYDINDSYYAWHPVQAGLSFSF